MSVEAYRIATTLALNIDPTIAGLNETIAAYRRVLEAQKAVMEVQRNLTASIRASATAARDFADQMERAARAGQGMASAANAAPAAATAAAAAVAAATARAVPAPPLLLAAPVRDFTMQGDSYGPGTSLVPTGSPRTWTEFTGARAPDASALAAMAAAGMPGFRGAGPGGGGGGGPVAPNGLGPGGIPLNAPPGGWPNQERGKLPMSDLFMAGYAGQRIGQASSGFIGDMFQQGAQEQAIEQRLARQGLSKEQVQAAYAAAVKAQQDSLGTYVNENMKTVLMLMGLTQSTTASLAEMPVAARASAVLSGLGRDGPAELNAVLRSAELRGVLMKEGSQTVDIGALNHFIRMTEDITALSGGRYGPTDLLQFMISSKAAGAMLDEKSLPGMLAMIQAVGPSVAGTQLVGFSQQFSSGKMSDGAFKFLSESGIIEHPELARKIAIGYHQLLPGAMGTDDLAQARGDPGAFITQRILPRVREYLDKNYGSAYTQGSETQKQQYEQATAQAWASRLTGGGFMAEIIRLAPLMLRDVRAAEAQAKLGDPYNAVVANNPQMLERGLAASANAAMVTLGRDNMSTIIEGIKAATAALQALNGAMIAHPSLAKEIFAIAAALAVLGTVVGTMMPAILLLGALKNLKGWAMPGAVPGGPAGAALGTAAAGIGAAGAGAVLGPAIATWAISSAISDKAAQMAAHKFDGLSPNAAAVAARFDSLSFWQKLRAEWHAGDMLMGPNFANPKDVEKYQIIIKNYIDGKEVAGSAIKSVVGQANGPQTGRGDFDPRRGFTQTEN